MNKHIKNLFVPHEGNNYKPDSLQRMSVGILSVLVLFSFAFANLQSLLWIASDWMVTAVLPGVLVELTNEERSDNALGSLSMSPVLTEAANMKAADMAKKEYFAHYAPDGTSPWHWFDEVSYNFVHAGENLAVHFTESDAVVKAWMESPAHRANILNGNYTEIGIGTARGEYKGFPTVFVVQLFGTPAATENNEVAPEVLASESSSETQQNDVTLETVTESEGNNTVAPATFETIPETSSEDKATSSTDIDSATDSDSLIVSTTPSTEIPEEQASPSEDVVVVYSDLATTSRNAVPAITETNGPGATTGSTPYMRIFAKSALIPSFWLQMLYGGVAAFVVFALIMSILIEWRRQHPVQIAYGTGLLAVMALLFYVHTALTSGVTII